MLLFSIIVVALAARAAAFGAQPDELPAHGESLQLEQQLANEKMQLLSAQEAPINSRHIQVIANDLLEQPEVEVADAQRRRQQQQQQSHNHQNHHHHHQHHRQHHNYQQPSSQQQQQQNQQKLLSQGVINGNHATYVEPPADFKPIIYDFDERQRANSAAGQQQASAASGESADNSVLNQLLSGMGQSARPMQDPILLSSNGAADYSGERPAASISHVEHQPASQHFSNSPDQPLESANQLKPSVGRWSDWHDMSIEPDLASSDTLASQHYSPLPTYYAASAPAPVPYKNRYGAAAPIAASPVAWISGSRRPVGQPTITIGGQPAAAQEELAQPIQAPARRLAEQANSVSSPLANGVLHHQPQQPQPPKRFLAFNQVRWPLPAAVDGSDLQQQQLQSQIKGSQSSSMPAMAPAPAVKGGSKLALNLLASQNNLLEVKQIQEHDSNQLRNQDQPLIWRQPQPQVIGQQQQPAKLNWEQQVPMPTKGGQSTKSASRKLKRRRKPKSHAEVRILKLVAADEQRQQQQQSAAHPKQVNGLSHKQPQVSSQAATEPLAAERVQSPAAHLQQHPVPSPVQIIRRLGSAEASPQTTRNAAQAAKRQRKRQNQMRSRTPVGLSSWLTGGMFNLDGRHWHLPAEVINRLAVNSVDFETQPKVEPPPAGSISLIDPQAADPKSGEQMTTTPQTTAGQQPARRTPISGHFSPR